MDGQTYIKILFEHLLPWKENHTENHDSFIYQQDNAPCHRSAIVKKWFHDVGLTSMMWPSYSPDLNPIENVWADIDRHLVKFPAKCLTDLEAEIAYAWHHYPQDKIRNLIESMPNRIKLCIEAKGNHTKY